MKTILWPLIGSLMLIGNSEAAEVIPRLTNQKLELSLTGLAIPDTYQKGFKSGIESTLLIRLFANTHGTKHSSANAVITIKYDLWEEVFRVTMVVDGAGSAQRSVAQLDGVLHVLADIELGDPLHLNELTLEEPFQIEAEVLINPIDREQIERLRKWVAANSAPRMPGELNVSSGALAPKPNDLFNKIFEQYLAGKDLVAPWRTTIKSPIFTRQQLLQSSSRP